MLYSLINNNQLILGPIKFNHMLINYELEQLDISTRLDSKSFQNIPIQFNSTTYLLPAREVFIPCDGKYQRQLPPVWSITRNGSVPTEVVFTYPVTNKTLNEVKQEVKNLVAPERLNREISTVTVGIGNTTVEVPTHRDSRVDFSMKLAATSKVKTKKVKFKFRSDLWLDLTYSDIETILDAIDAKVQSAYDWEFAKLQEIDTCTTIDDVYNVEITPKPVRVGILT